MSDLTVKDVASQLQCSTDTVRSLIRSGKLTAFRLNEDGSPWRINPEAITHYREQQQSRDPWARTRPRRRAS